MIRLLAGILDCECPVAARVLAPLVHGQKRPLVEAAVVVVTRPGRQQSATRAHRRRQRDLHVAAPAVLQGDLRMDVLQVAHTA